ncbi:MAG: PepSY-associated TM helix domain-containing protein [Steroidobacteraceae bacterium]
MSPRSLRTWSAAHTWSSLVCTAFLLMLCITGLPLIFNHEITDWVRAPGTGFRGDAPPAEAVTSYSSVDKQVAAALALYPNYYPAQVSFEDASKTRPRPRTTVLVVRSPDDMRQQEFFALFEQGRAHVISVDRQTNEILEIQDTRKRTGPVKIHPVRKFMLVVRDLHVDLFAELPGQLFLGLMGILFVIALVSGVVLYQPFMRRLTFGTVRTERSRRLKWLDLHNLLGIATLAWAAVVGITGVVNDLVTPINSAWTMNSIHPLKDKYADQGFVGLVEQVSIDKVLKAFDESIPDAKVTSVVFPGTDDHTVPSQFLVFAEGATPFTEKMMYPALVDARTGKVSDRVTIPWYMRTLEMSRPLHFGDYGGLPMKILWALLDVVTIIVLASGLYLWSARRRTRERPQSDDTAPELATEPGA